MRAGRRVFAVPRVLALNRSIDNFMSDESGVTAIEYGLIAAFIGVGDATARYACIVSTTRQVWLLHQGREASRRKALVIFASHLKLPRTLVEGAITDTRRSLTDHQYCRSRNRGFGFRWLPV